MAIGVIELVVLVLVVASLTKAIGSGHALYWLGAMAAIAVAVGLGVFVTYRVQQRPQWAYGIDEHTAELVNERLARGERVPDMYGGYGSTTSQVTEYKYRGAAVLVLLPLAAFATILAFRRAGPKGLLAGVAASFVLMMGGFLWFRVRHVEVMRPAEAYAQNTDSPVAAEPMDELWDRLTQPQIKMERASGGGSSRVELASATAVASEVEDHDAVEADASTTGPEANNDNRETAAEPVGDDSEEVVQSDSQANEVDNQVGEPDVEATQAQVAKEVDSPAPSRPKPEWVGAAREYVNQVWRVSVEAGPYVTKTECDRALWAELREEVTRRIQELAAENMGRSVHVPDLEAMGLGGTFIANELLADRTYYEEGAASFGATQTAWVLLEFDQNDDRRLLEAWQRYARRDGIKITAALSALVVSVLGLAFGLIKVDTWTRGYYSKRLFLGVPAAIIGVIFLLSFL